MRCTELLKPEEFHVKRVECTLEPSVGSGPIQVRVLLNDFKPDGVSLFCPEKLIPGTKAKLVIHEPRELELKGQVEWLAESLVPRRVLRESVQPYRLGIHFEFPTPEEAASFKAWCDELIRAFPGKGGSKKVA